MSIEQKIKPYDELLAGVVALGYMDRSLMDFGRALRVKVEEETRKANPDTSLIALLCDAARVGWELIRVAEELGATCRDASWDDELGKWKCPITCQPMMR